MTFDPDLVLTALVGIAGIIGTLLGVEWSARHAQAQMHSQWTRDDVVARRNQGKNAARSLLEELIRAAEQFDRDHRRKRIDEQWEMVGGSPSVPPSKREVPEWVVVPSRSEVEPHYRAIRRHAVEIADPRMTEWARHIAAVLWSPDDVVQFEGVRYSTEIGERLVAAGETVIGAYLRDDPLPEVADVPELSEMLRALEAAGREYEAQFEAWEEQERERSAKKPRGDVVQS